MSTNARIAIADTDGTYRSIYTHWDGYPYHHGPILVNHYSNRQVVSRLMRLGDLSMLSEIIGTKHPFDYGIDLERDDPLRDKYDRMCLAYGRDRGEKDVECVTHDSVGSLFEYACDSSAEWLYLYDVATGQWTVTNLYMVGEPFWVLLSDLNYDKRPGEDYPPGDGRYQEFVHAAAGCRRRTRENG